ncbi:hypothetical protein ABZ714_13130 [Streptomyces sp. NPDC006798]|uniref:hypothetical protein n=1 Tax=Streptomyces sp. NPDC006798 TaxID=3155462 RepID=UPI0033CC03A6
MAKYRVWLEETVTYSVVVEAEEYDEAEETARETLCEFEADQLAAHFDNSTGFEATNSTKIKPRVLVAA